MTRAELEHAIRAAWIDGAIGERSRFHDLHGFYVHGLNVEAATLPPGWRSRAVEVVPPGSENTKGICVEAHDLAASKLAAFRDKDREFVGTLLRERLIGAQKLLARVRSLPVEDALKMRLTTWVRVTAQGLGR